MIPEIKLYSYFGSQVFVSVISLEQITKTSTWNEIEAFPPLSPREAIKKAKTKIIDMFQSVKDQVSFESCNLKNYEENYWYYEIVFMLPIENGSYEEEQSSFNIYILLDGSVVELKEESFDDYINGMDGMG